MPCGVRHGEGGSSGAGEGERERERRAEKPFMAVVAVVVRAFLPACCQQRLPASRHRVRMAGKSPLCPDDVMVAGAEAGTCARRGGGA